MRDLRRNGPSSTAQPGEGPALDRHADDRAHAGCPVDGDVPVGRGDHVGAARSGGAREGGGVGPRRGVRCTVMRRSPSTCPPADRSGSSRPACAPVPTRPGDVGCAVAGGCARTAGSGPRPSSFRRVPPSPRRLYEHDPRESTPPPSQDGCGHVSGTAPTAHLATAGCRATPAHRWFPRGGDPIVQRRAAVYGSPWCAGKSGRRPERRGPAEWSTPMESGHAQSDRRAVRPTR